MSTRKHIYWYPNSSTGDHKTSAAVHILSEHGGGNLAECNKLVAELRETFPDAADENISVGRISRSSLVYGFTIVAWTTHLPKADYPGWHQSEKGIEYCW